MRLPRSSSVAAVAVVPSAGPAVAVALVPLAAAGLLLLAPVPGQAGQTLSPPVTATSTGATDAIAVTVTGTGRVLNGVVNNPNNAVSAVRGSTNGKGAGINGANYGTAGPAGKFEMLNAGSTQPGVYISMAGRGRGLWSQVTNADNGLAAVQGENTANFAGIGVSGSGAGAGLFGLSAAGSGVRARSDRGLGVEAVGGAVGVYAATTSPGQGIAGMFAGDVMVTGTLAVNQLTYLSDRDQKDGVVPADAQDVLERVARLPVSSWQFKDHAGVRHLGPMAQDFHAAFGLGQDERQIGASDIAGVSLAAIQGLHAQLRASQAQIAAQAAALEALQRRLDGLQAGAALPVPPAGAVLPTTEDGAAPAR